MTTMLDVLKHIADVIAHATEETLNDSINHGLESLGRFAAVDRAFLITFSSCRQTFTLRYEWCAAGIHSQLDYFIKLPVSVFPWTARQLFDGQTVATNTLADYPPEAEAERQICRDEGIQSIIFAPIIYQDRFIGAVGFDSVHRECEWTEPLIRLLEVAGALFAASIGQWRASARLRHLRRLERQQLGQDLHDTLGQHITAISLCAAALRKALREHDPELADQAAGIGDQSLTALESVRDITRDLLPPCGAGAPLVERLAQLATETQARTGIACTFVRGQTPPIEDPESCTQLFWIARESINNAIRHGTARQVIVTLERYGAKLSLAITDDGRGFPQGTSKSRGLGLKIMRYRAAAMGGQLTITSAAESGTRVLCVFPHPALDD